MDKILIRDISTAYDRSMAEGQINKELTSGEWIVKDIRMHSSSVIVQGMQKVESTLVAVLSSSQPQEKNSSF